MILAPARTELFLCVPEAVHEAEGREIGTVVCECDRREDSVAEGGEKTALARVGKSSILKRVAGSLPVPSSPKFLAVNALVSARDDAPTH